MLELQFPVLRFPDLCLQSLSKYMTTPMIDKSECEVYRHSDKSFDERSPHMTVRYCSSCNAKIEGNEENCPSCGANKNYFAKTSDEYYSKILTAAAKAESLRGPRETPVQEVDQKVDQKVELLNFSRRVSSLASTLGSLMIALGILTIIGGIIIAAQSTTLSDGAGFTMTTHPYVGLGIMVVFAGLLEALIFVLVFNYIELQAKFREWQLSN